jgi:hypothetical protein
MKQKETFKISSPNEALQQTGGAFGSFEVQPLSSPAGC